MSTDTYDIIVIGSGPGGYKAAITAAQLGARVAIIERERFGGICLNQGCIPKKTLLHLANLIDDVNALDGLGINGKVTGDFPAAQRHTKQVVTGIRSNFPSWLERLGIELYQGTAYIRDAQHVEVRSDEHESPTTLTGNRMILATGSQPREHACCSVDGTHIITSAHFMNSMDKLPESILFVGGGTIGTELSFLLHQFGSRVSIVEHASRLLNMPNIPERASRLIERKFASLGIDVRKNDSVISSKIRDGKVHIRFLDNSEASYEKVLIAIGRKPNTHNLGLENVNIRIDKNGYIITNKYLETDEPGIYAIGDITPGPMTANAALHDGKVAATNAVRGNQLSHNYHAVPIVIDSALEIAAVGLTEKQAENAGFEPDVARGNFTGSPKARGRQDYEGFIEVVHDEETGQMLGGCIVGPEAGEQIQMLTAACQSPRGLWLFTDINYSHPSWCEELEHAIYPYTSQFTTSGKEVFRPGIYAVHDK